MLGRFITFEGGDGSGKSTQIRLLQKYLQSQGIETVLTREPGGSVGGEDIRKLLVTGDPDRWDEQTEALLFYAARRNHIETLIKPALAEGKWVLSDRFFDSSIAYQSYGRGLDLTYLLKIHQLAIGDFTPDKTFILDIDPEIGLKRALARQNDGEDRFEHVDFSFHQRLRQGFLKIAEQNPDRCGVISADQSIEKIQTTLQKLCLPLIKKKDAHA